MTVARAAALAAVLLAAVLAVLLLVGGAKTREYSFLFQNAGQLVQGNDVQVAGRRVGTVTGIELTTDNQAKVDVLVQEPYAPLREGTRAVIRATSLSGVANRYVALAPTGADRRELPDGAVLQQDSTRSIVDLDQFFATFDPETRRGLQDVIKGFATQLDGKGAQANEAARYFNPLLSSTRRLTGQLARDERALTEFLVNTGQAMSTLAARRGELTELVGNANATARAVAAEDDALDRALELLPTTLRRGNTTFVNLRATLEDLDVLVEESKPATRELASFLRELRPLVQEARPTIRDLRTLVRRDGANNDAVEATRQLPALQRAATRSFANADRALEDLQPVLSFARPYTPELTGWIRSFGQSSAPYDANGHYARVQPIFGGFRFTDDEQGGVLTPVPPAERFEGFERNRLNRCPGAATQPARDGSSPFVPADSGLAPGDCDPEQVPPGP